MKTSGRQKNGNSQSVTLKERAAQQTLIRLQMSRVFYDIE
jgi:hypothetical protein